MNVLVIIAAVYITAALAGIGWAGEHAKAAEESERHRDAWAAMLLDAGWERVNGE